MKKVKDAAVNDWFAGKNILAIDLVSDDRYCVVYQDASIATAA